MFKDPKEWDAIALPRASYSVVSVLPDSRLVVAAAWDDPPDADYLTRDLEWWQARCLMDGARLLDGSTHRQVCRPLARDDREG